MHESVKMSIIVWLNVCDNLLIKDLHRMFLLVYVWQRQKRVNSKLHPLCASISLFWHHIFWEPEVEFWHVWEALAVGGYFMPVSLNEFWWAAMVQTSLTVPTSLCSFPVFMSDPQQPTGEALSAARSESLSVWSTSNIFEQFRQGWVQVIQSLPKECFGEMRSCAGSQGVAEKLGTLISVLLQNCINTSMNL